MVECSWSPGIWGVTGAPLAESGPGPPLRSPQSPGACRDARLHLLRPDPRFLSLSQPNRGTKRPRDDEEEELKTRRKQAGPRERGRHREEEAAVVEEAEDDKKRLLQIMDREGEEEEEEVLCRGPGPACRPCVPGADDPCFTVLMGFGKPRAE